MQIAEAVARFRNWPDRAEFPVRSVGCWPPCDTWWAVATAAVQLIGALDTATTDDDLRAALVAWCEQRRLDPIHRNGMDDELQRAAHDVIYDTLYPRVPGRGRTIVVHPPPSVHHSLHLDRNERRTIEVTPALARGILDLNLEMRGQELSCPDGCIVRFMGKIRSGEWTAADPNPATTPFIRVDPAFTRDGEPIPGEFDYYTNPGAHRLQSIVNAGVAVPVEFIAPSQAFDEIKRLANVVNGATTQGRTENQLQPAIA